MADPVVKQITDKLYGPDEPIRIPRDYNIHPVRVAPDSDSFDSLNITASGDFTLTEALNFANSIMRMVHDYGKVQVEPK